MAFSVRKLWRPVGASVALVLISARYAGWIDPGLSENIEMKILSIFQWLIAAYVVGRSGEKVAGVIKPIIEKR